MIVSSEAILDVLKNNESTSKETGSTYFDLAQGIGISAHDPVSVTSLKKRCKFLVENKQIMSGMSSRMITVFFMR